MRATWGGRGAEVAVTLCGSPEGVQREVTGQNEEKVGNRGKNWEKLGNGGKIWENLGKPGKSCIEMSDA
jgi:hypothetical protein